MMNSASFIRVSHREATQQILLKKLCYYLAVYSVTDVAQKCSLVSAGEAIYKIMCCEMEG